MSNRLSVGGIVSLTTVDFPGYLASVVFLQGCPWRCVYCHNPSLQEIFPGESLPWEDIMNLLRSRQGFLEGVVFSGGEPLVQEALQDAISEVKELGYKIGLHTSGALPNRFAKVLPFLDWVGLDIKQRFQNYHLITNIPGSGDAALESLNLALASGVSLEVRTTMHESITKEDVVKLSEELTQKGVRNFVLQKCRDKDENIVEHPLFSDKLMLEGISKQFDSFCVRS